MRVDWKIGTDISSDEIEQIENRIVQGENNVKEIVFEEHHITEETLRDILHDLYKHVMQALPHIGNDKEIWEYIDKVVAENERLGQKREDIIKDMALLEPILSDTRFKGNKALLIGLPILMLTAVVLSRYAVKQEMLQLLIQVLGVYLLHRSLASLAKNYFPQIFLKNTKDKEKLARLLVDQVVTMKENEDDTWSLHLKFIPSSLDASAIYCVLRMQVFYYNSYNWSDEVVTIYDTNQRESIKALYDAYENEKQQLLNEFKIAFQSSESKYSLQLSENESNPHLLSDSDDKHYVNFTFTEEKVNQLAIDEAAKKILIVYLEKSRMLLEKYRKLSAPFLDILVEKNNEVIVKEPKVETAHAAIVREVKNLPLQRSAIATLIFIIFTLWLSVQRDINNDTLDLINNAAEDGEKIVADIISYLNLDEEMEETVMDLEAQPIGGLTFTDFGNPNFPQGQYHIRGLGYFNYYQGIGQFHTNEPVESLDPEARESYRRYITAFGNNMLLIYPPNTGIYAYKFGSTGSNQPNPEDFRIAYYPSYGFYMASYYGSEPISDLWYIEWYVSAEDARELVPPTDLSGLPLTSEQADEIWSLAAEHFGPDVEESDIENFVSQSFYSIDILRNPLHLNQIYIADPVSYVEQALNSDYFSCYPAATLDAIWQTVEAIRSGKTPEEIWMESAVYEGFASSSGRIFEGEAHRWSMDGDFTPHIIELDDKVTWDYLNTLIAQDGGEAYLFTLDELNFINTIKVALGKINWQMAGVIALLLILAANKEKFAKTIKFLEQLLVGLIKISAEMLIELKQTAETSTQGTIIGERVQKMREERELSESQTLNALIYTLQNEFLVPPVSKQERISELSAEDKSKILKDLNAASRGDKAALKRVSLNLEGYLAEQVTLSEKQALSIEPKVRDISKNLIKTGLLNSRQQYDSEQ